MKLKNLAFFGVMGAILSVAGANADPYTGTNAYLTTKGYVDTRDTATLNAAQNYTDTVLQNYTASSDLGTMAAEDKDDYYTKEAADAAFATAAQGGKADTAVQPGDLGTMATEAAANYYTKTAADAAFATAAQGALAATALQSANITASGTTNKIVQYGANGLITAGTDAGTLATVSPSTSTCPSGKTCLVTKNSDGTHQYTPITDSSDLPAGA